MKSIALLLSSLSLLAAGPSPGPKPPSKVDKALRKRIDEFYKLQVDKHFREAESYIAADSKDYYYEARKPDLKGFTLEKIEYSPDFKTAVATVRAKLEIFFTGAGPMVVESAGPTDWKIEKGKWCWYFDQKSHLNTPFGKSVPLSKGEPPAEQQSAVARRVTAAVAQGVAQPDRQRIELDAAHPKTEIVNVKNLIPGSLTIQLASESKAFTVAIAKPSLGAGESTEVAITPVEGTTERPDVVTLRVLPLNQAIPIAITWAPPPKQ